MNTTFKGAARRLDDLDLPTGTGTAIADGTCVWDYAGVKAVFTALANLPQQFDRRLMEI